jgi:hypothetical protein
MQEKMLIKEGKQKVALIESISQLSFLNFPDEIVLEKQKTIAEVDNCIFQQKNS